MFEGSNSGTLAAVTAFGSKSTVDRRLGSRAGNIATLSNTPTAATRSSVTDAKGRRNRRREKEL